MFIPSSDWKVLSLLVLSSHSQSLRHGGWGVVAPAGDVHLERMDDGVTAGGLAGLANGVSP